MSILSPTPPLSLRLPLALLLAGLCACSGPTPRVPAPSAPPDAACDVDDRTDSAALYGAWTVQIEGQPAGRLQLQRHPEYPGSVSGSYQRGDSAHSRVQVVGDLEQGQLTLEESRDGQHTSGRWRGHWVAPDCSREIQGVWLDSRGHEAPTGPTEQRPFLMRRAPGGG
jgi:hypothetical protein